MIDDLIKIKKEDGEDTICCSDNNHYPYGTSLSLSDDLIEELGLDNLAVTDVVEVRGFAFVESKSKSCNMDSSHKSLGLQFTALKIYRQEDDIVERLYGVKS